MDLSPDQGGRVRVALSHPPSLPGVHVGRFSSDGHLFRSVKDRFAARLHLAGRTEWSLRGKRWSSGPGTVDLKLPGEVHDEHARDGVARFDILVFDGVLVDDARAALERPYTPPSENALDGADPRVASIVALHARLLDRRAAAPDLEDALALALRAFIELTSGPLDRPRTRHAWSVAVARARALLDARFPETVPLDELAAHACLDKFHLVRAFRDEVGLPPHAYVTHRRVALARSLLARGVAQAEVAARVGLYDQSQLHRHFKRILGLTPGAYARAVR